MKILVIEDHLEIRENLVELLELAGYKAVSADNGETGLDMVLTELPDLILCDVMMPVKDGHHVFDAVNGNSSTRHIPFIFITSSVEQKGIHYALCRGANGYIKKPFDEKELFQTINTCLLNR